MITNVPTESELIIGVLMKEASFENGNMVMRATELARAGFCAEWLTSLPHSHLTVSAHGVAADLKCFKKVYWLIVCPQCDISGRW